MKEPERQLLQDTLHKDVMRKIIFLQRWFRARLQRKEFLDMRQAAILIQVRTVATSAPVRGFESRLSAERISPGPFLLLQRSWRRYCRDEQRRQAATLIQAVWRGHKQRTDDQRKKQGATKIQALVRGHSARRR